MNITYYSLAVNQILYVPHTHDSSATLWAKMGTSRGRGEGYAGYKMTTHIFFPEGVSSYRGIQLILSWPHMLKTQLGSKRNLFCLFIMPIYGQI
jgi:hypothetical protein